MLVVLVVQVTCRVLGRRRRPDGRARSVEERPTTFNLPSIGPRRRLLARTVGASVYLRRARVGAPVHLRRRRACLVTLGLVWQALDEYDPEAVVASASAWAFRSRGANPRVVGAASRADECHVSFFRRRRRSLRLARRRSLRERRGMLSINICTGNTGGGRARAVASRARARAGPPRKKALALAWNSLIVVIAWSRLA